MLIQPHAPDHVIDFFSHVPHPTRTNIRFFLNICSCHLQLAKILKITIRLDFLLDINESVNKKSFYSLPNRSLLIDEDTFTSMST